MMAVEGYDYRFDPAACATCGGRCCNGESGRVGATREEAVALAAAMDMELSAFCDAYLLPDGGAWRVREIQKGANYACALFDAEHECCAVYDARPAQCRSFPFWEYWKTHAAELMRECPGVHMVYLHSQSATQNRFVPAP